MFSLFDFMRFVAELILSLGLLVFGAAAGWFTLYAFRERPWQLQIAAFLGFFFFSAAITFSTSASGVGAFAFGAGASLLFWGLRHPNQAEEDQSVSG